MPTLPRGALQSRRSSITFLGSAWFALIAAANAQSPSPFANPIANGTFSLDGTVGLLDVNRDGSVDLVVPGIFFGTYATTLDESGNALFTNANGPTIGLVPGASNWPTAIAMAAGRLDQDDREDLVSITACGSVHLHRNLGACRIDTTAFATDVLVDVFAAAFPINPPFTTYSFPCATVVDFDGDGHRDIVLAGGPVDWWSGATLPGFAAIYRGDGTGNFQVVRAPLPGNVVDAEVADLDGDGAIDHLVVLDETGAAGTFTQHLIHLALVGGSLQTVATQWIGPGRCTALELADMLGGPDLDYVVAQTMSSSAVLTSGVTCFAGDGLGHADLSNWSSCSLPPNLTGLGEFIAAIQIDDFDHDGHADLAALRGFVHPQPPSAGAVALTGDSELLVSMGPNAMSAPAQRIPLQGAHQWSWTHSTVFPMLPLRAQPDLVRVIDLGRDHDADLLVTGLRQSLPNGGAQVHVATLLNTSPPRTGEPAYCQLGSPSGGSAAHPARIGFDGGEPRLGNPNFACTIANVQGGALVGLMWGTFGYADLTTVLGFQLHLSPTEFGYAAVASGSHAGEGFHSYALPIPPDPALVGDVGWFQYCYYDPLLDRFGGTQATGVWVAP